MGDETAFFRTLPASLVSPNSSLGGLVALLNEYLTAMCDIIAEHEGTVDKFEGDAIIAFWGAPLDQPDHALKACLAAIDMQRYMTDYRKRLEAEGRPLLEGAHGAELWADPCWEHGLSAADGLHHYGDAGPYGPPRGGQ